MELINLQVQKRENFKKGYARRFRAAGRVPGMIYGHGLENVAVTINTKELQTIIRRHIGRNYILNLAVEGDTKSERWALVRETQKDPVSDELLHIDLYELNRDEPIYLTVPLHFSGNPDGVRAGGVLETIYREIEVKCLPKDIPERIELNIQPLTIGQSLHVSDLNVPGVQILSDPDQVIVQVIVARAVEEVKPEAAAAGEEGAPKEPELIKKEPAKKEKE
jgi:large subunit ribosomal protein L25